MRLYEWYKSKTFCCAFFAAAMLTMVAASTIVRFPPVILQGVYPDAMIIVIALFKGGIKSNPNNYRPISLLSHFDKIFEKKLCKRLIAFLEQK